MKCPIQINKEVYDQSIVGTEQKLLRIFYSQKQPVWFVRFLLLFNQLKLYILNGDGEELKSSINTIEN